MSEYKVIFRADVDTSTVTWEPPCPLMFEAIQIARHTRTAEAYLQGKVRNIGDQEISAFQATIAVCYEDGSEQEVEFKPLDADIVPGRAYQLTPVPLDQGTAVRASGRIESVKNEWGRTIWESSADLISPPEPIHLHLTTKAQDERSRLWAEAFSNGSLRHDPQIAHLARTHDADDHDEWWVCPCGQVNVNLANCLSCGLPLASWSEVPTDNETLEKIADERIKKEEEERAARKEKRDQAVAKSKAVALKFLKIGVPIIVGIVVVVLALTFLIIPTVRYNSANGLAEAAQTNEEYQRAYDAFLDLGDQGDSPQRLIAVATAAGDAAYNSEDYENAAYWYDLAGDNELSQKAKISYVQEHPSADDQLALAYFIDLATNKYERVEELYEQLFGWTFEFSMVSDKDYSAAGNGWTQSATVLPKSAGNDFAGLLIMPKGGTSGNGVGLDIEIENVQLGSTSTLSWSTKNTKSVSFLNKNGELLVDESGRSNYKKMEKPFIYVSLGSNKHDMAWGVTVTDHETGVVLFTGEIRTA